MVQIFKAVSPWSHDDYDKNQSDMFFAANLQKAGLFSFVQKMSLSPVHRKYLIDSTAADVDFGIK